VDSPRVLVACSFASVGFFGNNKSSSLKQLKPTIYISGTVSTITGIHSKIVNPVAIERVKRGLWILFWKKCLGLVLAISISESLDHYFVYIIYALIRHEDPDKELL
jgi:hypothetical protein